MRAALAALAATAACGHAPPAPAPAPAPSNAARPKPAPALARVACPAPGPELDEDPYLALALAAPAEAALVCDESRHKCSVTVPVTLTNCRPDPVMADKPMYLDTDHPWVTLDAAFPHTVAPGESWTFSATTRGAGDVTIRVKVSSTIYRTWVHHAGGVPPDHIDRTHPDGMTFDLSAPTMVVTNPARVAAIAACRACNGDWGHHQMMVTIDPSPGVDGGEDCLCRSTDASKVCRDGDDCQGWCELERFDVVGRTGNPPVEIGYAVGRCSEFTSQRSCVNPIPSGASKRPPAPREDHQMCID